MESTLQSPLQSALSVPWLPTPDALRDPLIKQQQQLIEQQSRIIAEQQKRLALLEEQIRLLRAKRFGPSSEQSSAQLPLFDEDPPPPEPAPPPPPSPPKKRRGGRKGLSPDLPRQTIYLRLSDEQKAGALETFFVKVKE
jgi:uncharacterized coiled-coil protein SlyX